MSISDLGTESIPISPALEPANGTADRNRRGLTAARVIMALMLREMTTKYGRTPGGYVWAIFEPVAMITVFAFATALVMRSPSLGNSFIVFYASGYLAFNQYRTLESVVTKALSFSRGLLRYPVVTWLDAIMARFLLNLLTNVLNTILILAGVIYLEADSTYVRLGPMVEAMTLAALLALGYGTLNALLSGIWPLWSTLYKVITRPLMLASAVLYIVEDLPPLAADILWYNPISHVTGLMRSGVFVTYNPQYISIPYVVATALVPLAIGLVFLRKHAVTIISGE
ncbi:MAG: ABC transporter permease [Maritimibacter sp.]|nr:ABC transporter permease [Maritimibacter sp.]